MTVKRMFCMLCYQKPPAEEGYGPFSLPVCRGCGYKIQQSVNFLKSVGLDVTSIIPALDPVVEEGKGPGASETKEEATEVPELAPEALEVYRKMPRVPKGT